VAVSLVILDSANRQATSSTSITVDAPPPSSGGGGGAMQLGWLLGWLASVIGVWCVTPRRRNAD